MVMQTVNPLSIAHVETFCAEKPGSLNIRWDQGWQAQLVANDASFSAVAFSVTLAGVFDQLDEKLREKNL